MVTAQKLFNNLISALSDRQQEVISGRFGLDSGGVYKTLAAIGDRMHVTRERIRQIENSAIELVSRQISKDPVCAQVTARSRKYLKNAGGVIKNNVLLDNLKDAVEGLGDHHLALLIEALPTFYYYPENDDFWPFYYLAKTDLKTAANFVDGWTAYLHDHKPKILEGAYHEHFKSFVKTRAVNKNHAENYLGISKKICKNQYGDLGLRDWPEIKPMTTRDRIYLVLKKRREPLHFADIAKVINETGFGGQAALAPTVHNELIKDERFVLVGRGMYALREHGYEPGIAREVIQRILRQEGPLKPSGVVAQMSKQRFFKPNTILINLQNKNFFERLPDGRYRVRES
jgi:hypothetical protein